MTTYTVSRMLETFFRRWWLYAVPVVLMSLFGIYLALGAGESYRSSATISVADTTLLSTLSDVRANPNYGFESPAEVTSRRFNTLLSTQRFATAVADAAGLAPQIDAGTITLDEVRTSVYASPNGANLFRVIGTTRDPSLAPRLVAASMDEFVKVVVESETSDSAAAESFYGELADEYKLDVDNAQKALDDFLAANPSLGPDGTRPEAVQVQIDRLSDTLDQAKGRYDSVLTKSLDAQLATRQSKADVGQRLTVVDQPTDPVPTSGLRVKAMGFAPWFFMGLIISGLAVLGAAMLDKTIRTPADVTNQLGLRSLAYVPQVSPVRLRQVHVATTGAAALGTSPTAAGRRSASTTPKGAPRGASTPRVPSGSAKP